MPQSYTKISNGKTSSPHPVPSIPPHCMRASYPFLPTLLLLQQTYQPVYLFLLFDICSCDFVICSC